MPAKLEIPTKIGGNIRWWLWHNVVLCKCEYAWYAGPFDTEPDAEKFRDTLVHPTSCPGCGIGTPDKGDYDIGQM